MILIYWLALLFLATGCYAGESLQVMREANARGCVFIRAAATPIAGGGIVLIGTWGQDPPPYAECFSTIPSVP